MSASEDCASGFALPPRGFRSAEQSERGSFLDVRTFPEVPGQHRVQPRRSECHEAGVLRVVFGAFVGLLLSVAIPSPALAQSAGLVVGVVVSSTGEKIPGASVNLEGVGSTMTDPLGRFRFADVPPGNYRIVASRDGFSTENRYLVVLGGRRNEILITLAGSGPLVSPYAGGEVVVPIERRGAAILVQARVNDQVLGVFVVDTGATLTVISRQVAESVGIWAGAETPMISLRTAGGIVEAPLVQVQSLRVGDLEAREVRAVVLDIPGFPPQIAGLLGLSFLGRFKVSIDVENGRMILGPP